MEGDASSASYFLAGAAIRGGPVTVKGCGTESLQGDSRFAEVLEKMGANVEWREREISVSGSSINGIDVSELNLLIELIKKNTTKIRHTCRCC